MDNIINLNIETPTPTVSIASSAMLVELSISQWSARKKDRNASDQVASSNGAKSTSVSVTKALIDCEELKAIAKMVGQVRNNYHYPMTLPWSDTGMRLIPTAHYFDYAQRMSAYEQEFNQLVDDFVLLYDSKVQSAVNDLGALFDHSLYPSASEVRAKFAFRVNYMPVPEAGDFRVDVASEQKDALSNHYQSFYERQIKAAMDKVWHDLYEALSHVSEKLDWSDDKDRKRLFASTFDNMNHLIRCLETCNFTNDPDMSRMQRKLALVFSDVNAESLKNNSTLRAEVKRDIDAALKSLPSLDF